MLERPRAALESRPGAEVTVDLTTRTVACEGLEVPFEVDDYTRWRLLEGLDDIGLTLRHVDLVGDFESHRPNWLPTTLPAR